MELSESELKGICESNFLNKNLSDELNIPLPSNNMPDKIPLDTLEFEDEEEWLPPDLFRDILDRRENCRENDQVGCQGEFFSPP